MGGEHSRTRLFLDICERNGVRFAIANGITGKLIWHDPTGKLEDEVPALHEMLPAIEVTLRTIFAEKAKELGVTPQRIAFAAYVHVRDALRQERRERAA